MRLLSILALVACSAPTTTTTSMPKRKTMSIVLEPPPNLPVTLVVVRTPTSTIRRVVKKNEPMRLKDLPSSAFKLEVMSLNGEMVLTREYKAPNGDVSIKSSDLRHGKSRLKGVVPCVVYGTVADRNGPLAHAQVTVYLGQRSISKNADRYGYFLIEGMPCATLKVVVDYELIGRGSFTETRTNVTPTEAKPAELRFILKTDENY